MKKGFIFILSFIILFACTKVSAQERERDLITGDFHDIPFGEFIKILEAQTGYHFYYDPTAFEAKLLSFL